MAKWTYEARREPDSGVAAVVVVEKEGEKIEFPLHHFVKHSPTGFEFGYGGSGPADLAYSILVHWFQGNKLTLKEAMEEAGIQYQEFKRAFVAPCHEPILRISDDEIGRWWMQKEISKADQRLSGQVQAENGQTVTVTVRDTATADHIRQYGRYLVSDWCKCGKDSEFLCYPEDGACTCGIHKHHVHCRKCGGVSQIG